MKWHFFMKLAWFYHFGSQQHEKTPILPILARNGGGLRLNLSCGGNLINHEYNLMMWLAFLALHYVSKSIINYRWQCSYLPTCRSTVEKCHLINGIVINYWIPIAKCCMWRHHSSAPSSLLYWINSNRSQNVYLYCNTEICLWWVHLLFKLYSRRYK